MAKSVSAGPADSTKSFEDAMSELEGIVHVLEDSRLPLDELVLNYERGSLLLQICQQRLDAAQQRIEIINQTKAGGLTTAPFEKSDTPPPAPAKPARKASSPDHANSDEIRLL